MTKSKRFNFNTSDENLTATKGVSEDKRLLRLFLILRSDNVDSCKLTRKSCLTDLDFCSLLFFLFCGSDLLDPLFFYNENRVVEFDMIEKQMN